MVLEGALTLTVGGVAVQATPGTVVQMPANVPHAVDAPQPARMLLLMLRDGKDGLDLPGAPRRLMTGVISRRRFDATVRLPPR